MPAANASGAPTNGLANILDTGFMPSWGMLIADDLEDNDALRFPQSIANFGKMMADAQVQGLQHGSTWPIYRMKWYLEPGEARADGVERISGDLALPIGEDAELPPHRTKNRFKFTDHMEEALDACFLGFKLFEQRGEILGDGMFHYRKLLNIPPTSIAEVNLDPDGGINWIKQQGYDPPQLDISRLVWYAFQKRGANWYGRSLLRGCYGPWLLKDRALRVGVMNLQRAGVGTPVIEAHPGATDTELIVLNRLAERFKAGERTGGAIPAGAKLRLVGVEGNQPDAVGFAKLMNEEMARAFLQMFMQAGQTGTGSRSTTETWVDWHKLTLEYIANWVATIFSEHVIEDDWEWNYGEEEEAVPVLKWKWDDAGSTTNPQGPQAAADPAAQLRQQINDGTVQAPPDVAAWLDAEPGRTSSARRHAGRRHRDGESTRAAGLGPTAVPPLPLPSRSLRRQLYDHEITAAVDYNAIDTAYQSALDLLIQEVRQLQGYQIGELHDAIVEAAGDLDKLSELEATPEHADMITLRLKQVVDLAANQHVEEARRQGVTMPRPDTSKLDASIKNRSEAIDNLLTRNLGQSASRIAMRLSGGTLTSAEVADKVRLDLQSRSDAYMRDILGGGVQKAINDGRGVVMREAGPNYIYASELLDNATCAACAGIDGTQYQTMDDAERDYPGGGFTDCAGGERCRGMLVAIYNETGAAG
jgi:hypothetical protein